MNLPRLSFAYLKARPLNTALNLVLLALGVGTIALHLLASHQIEERMGRDARGIDLVALDTTGLSLGDHTLKLRVYNGLGSAVPTNIVTISLLANAPPFLLLDNPQTAPVLVGTAITNLVTATDDVAVVRVEWHLGDTPVFTRPIEQSFALLDMGGIAGVRVLPENNEVGRTAQDGRLMLTDVPPYSEIKIAVDPLTVPMDVTIPQNVLKVATLPRTGQIVRYEAKRERNALVRLVFPDGGPVPPGSAVSVDGRSELYPVGMDGEVYLPGVGERQTIQVRSNGKSCRIELLVPPGGDAVADIGPLTCNPTIRSARR